jgi:integrase
MDGNTITRSPNDKKAPAGGGKKLPRRRPLPSAPGIYYRPRKDGIVGPPYEFAYLDLAGKRRWQVVHSGLANAQQRQAKLRTRLRRPQLDEQSETLARYAEAWLNRQHVRPRTIDRYRWSIDQHLIPRLGRYPLNAISTQLIRNLIEEMRRDGLTGWTISTALQPLSMLLADAERNGHIHGNPMRQLDRRDRPRHTDQRPRRILTLDEMKALLQATTNHQHRCLLELLLTTGLRIGEALGLTAADLDPTHSIIQIRQQLDRQKTRQPLKTPSSERAIDIPAPLLQRMQQLLEHRNPDTDHDALVFASRNNTGLERKTCRNALNRASAAANLQPPHPNLHDLRHSHASMLIALNYALPDVQHRLGHARADTTLRIYTHQWRYRNTQRSTIGERLNTLLTTPSPDGASKSSTAAPQTAPAPPKTGQ